MNPFGSDDDESEKPVPLRRNKSMSLTSLNYNTSLRNKSTSLINVNSSATLGRRRKSRKSYRAPEPPKGVRPFSLILETSAEKTA